MIDDEENQVKDEVDSAGVGTVVLATCCLNKYKQRKRNKQNKANIDNGLPLTEKQSKS